MAELIEGLAARIPDDWGVQPVPPERRTLRPFDFAVLWGDLAVSLLVMVAGSLLVPGLGTKEAVLAVVVGTALGTALLSLVGIAGSDTGVPTMVALRAPFGIRGSYMASGFNIAQLSAGRRSRSSSCRRRRKPSATSTSASPATTCGSSSSGSSGR